MEALLFLLGLAGLAASVLGIVFYARLWRVLGAHGQAMRELHLYLNDRRASMHVPPRPPADSPEHMPRLGGHVPPQPGPHTRWNTPGSQEGGQ